MNARIQKFSTITFHLSYDQHHSLDVSEWFSCCGWSMHCSLWFVLFHISVVCMSLILCNSTSVYLANLIWAFGLSIFSSIILVPHLFSLNWRPLYCRSLRPWIWLVLLLLSLIKQAPNCSMRWIIIILSFDEELYSFLWNWKWVTIPCERVWVSWVSASLQVR